MEEEQNCDTCRWSRSEGCLKGSFDCERIDCIFTLWESMNDYQHIRIHKKLHKNFDQLVDDFIIQTKKLPSHTTILELMQWSSNQCVTPTGVYRCTHS